MLNAKNSKKKYLDVNTVYLGSIYDYKFVCRNSNNSNSFLLNQSCEDVSIIKRPGTINNEQCFLTFDIDDFDSEMGFSINIDIMKGYNLQNKKLVVEFILVKDNFELKDPFLLDKSKIIENIKYSFNVDSNSNFKFLIFPNYQPPIDSNHKAIVRIQIPSNNTMRTRWNDGVTIKEIKKHELRNRSILDFVQYSYDEIVFPEVRYINCKESNKLLVSFAPLNVPKYKYNTYDFFMNCGYNRLIISDSSNQWYLRGFKSLGDTVDDTIKIIDKFVKMKNYQIYTFGVSMGGYGSFIYGNKLYAKRIISINPEYELMDKNTISSRNMSLKNSYLKLYSFFIKFNNKRSDIVMLFSAKSPVDLNSYNRIGSYKNIDKYLIDEYHNFGEYLDADPLWIMNYYELGSLKLEREIV